MANRLHHVVISLWLLGCPATENEVPPPPPRGGLEPILPLPSASATPSVPSWIERLPALSETPPKLDKGDKVWATTAVGSSEMADVAIFTVEGVYDGLCSLTSRTAQRIDGVHPALVHPAPAMPRLVGNNVVLFYTPSTPAFIGKVDDVIAGESIKIRYDQGGTTKTTEAVHVQKPVVGVKPMAYVTFPKAGATSRGLVLAVADEQVWLRTASGHVEVHDRARVEALSLPPTRIDVGAKVRAYSWATGYEAGVVTKVIEEELRFEVQRDRKRIGTYFFSSLVSAK